MSPFREEGCVVQTLQQKGLTLVAWLSRFKEAYISWMNLRASFLYNTRTKQLALVVDTGNWSIEMINFQFIKEDKQML